MDETTKNIDQEIARLRSKLSQDPDYKRLRNLEEFRAKHVDHMAAAKELLGGVLSAPSGEDVKPPPPNKPKRNRKRSMKKKTSPTDLIIARTCLLLERHGEPMPLALLHDKLLESGIIMGGKDTRINLCSKLSTAPEVYNVPNLGWWLTAKKSEMSENEEGLTNGVARPSKKAGSEAKFFQN